MKLLLKLSPKSIQGNVFPHRMKVFSSRVDPMTTQGGKVGNGRDGF
jgi:hypothetical protein